MSSSSFSHRPFCRADDLQAVLALVSMRPPELIAAYPSILDLQEACGTPGGQAGIRLWQDAGGKCLGFTLLDGDFLAFEVSSRADFDDLAGAMLAWAVERLASTGEPPAASAELATGCREEDLQKRAFLERQGFAAQPVHTLHFMRSLNETIPEPILPDGFLIRPIAGDEEAAAWVALHRAAHGTENMTVDYRLSMMRAPDYDRNLDLVAVAPDGRLAAYVVCHFSPEENRLRQKMVGFTDPVATHPDFQGKGLARALLLAGFARLKQHSMEFAEVGTWGENTGMIRTAESAGCRLYSTTIFFNRPLLRAGP